MIIKDIIIKNFLSHKKTTINVGLGITTIVGENGAGKSGILDAIYYALFNKTNRESLDDLLTHGAKSLEVILNFSLNNKNYHICRKRRKGSSTVILKEIINNNKERVLASNIKDARREIEETIGLNEDLFKNAIYIQQGEIDDLISKITPSTRKEIISRLLGLTKYDLAYREIGNVIKHFEQKFAKTSGEILRVPVLEKELHKENRELNKQKIIIDELKVKHKKLKKEYDEMNIEFKNLKEKKKDFDKLNSELIRIESNLEAEKTNKDRIEKELKRITKAENDLAKILPDLKHLHDIKSATKIIENLEKSEIKLKPVTKELEQYIECENTIRENKDSYEEYKSNITKLNDLETAIESLNEINVEYKTKMSLRENLDEEIKENKITLQNNLDKMKKRDYPISKNNKENIEFLEKQLKSLEKEKRQLNEKIDKIKENIGIEEGRILETKKFIQTLKIAIDKCPICNAPLTEKHKAEVLEIQNDKISKSQNEKEKYNSKKKTLENSESKIKKEINFLNDKLNPKAFLKLTNDIDNDSEKLKKLDDRLKEITDTVEEFEKLIEERKNLQNRQGELKNQYDDCSFAIKTIEGKSKQQIENKKKKHEKQIESLHGKLDKIMLKTGITEGQIISELERLEKEDVKKKNLEAIIERKDQQDEEHEESKTNLEGFKEDKSAKEKEIKDLEFDTNEYSEIEKAFEQKRNDYNDAKSNLRTERATYRQKKEYIKKTKDDLEDLIAKSKQQEKLNNFIEFLKKIKKIFHKDGIPEIIRQDTKPKIEYHTQRIFQNFNLLFSGLNLTNDYNIILHDNLNEYKFGLVSGGEKIAAALALRLGIAKALAGKELELVLLDEPTVHLDPQRREDLVGILIQMRSIPQVIVVSHDEEMKKAADTILTVELKDGYSRVKHEILE